LTFRQNFNLEASDVDPNLGFDGGVLEVSFDGGNTFRDILDAGGSFVQGGYNRTISTDRGSPIAGRQAWSGNSEGFITTVVDLPILSTGTRLRWRMASDTSGSGEGWRVDTVNIAGCAPVPCQTPTARPRITPFPRPTRPPRNLPSASQRGLRWRETNSVAAPDAVSASGPDINNNSSLYARTYSAASPKSAVIRDH
jgi:hypothetical protein